MVLAGLLAVLPFAKLKLKLATQEKCYREQLCPFAVLCSYPPSPQQAIWVKALPQYALVTSTGTSDVFVPLVRVSHVFGMGRPQKEEKINPVRFNCFLSIEENQSQRVSCFQSCLIFQESNLEQHVFASIVSQEREMRTFQNISSLHISCIGWNWLKTTEWIFTNKAAFF